MKCFVIMPYAEQFGDVYATIKRAVGSIEEVEVECLRLDEMKAAGRITDDLLRELNAAAVCVADLTGNNPNVMWEVGYAMALDKPVIFISQEGSTRPFDIKDMRINEYERDSLESTLEKRLTESFRATLSQITQERTDVLRPMPGASALSMAVTGSMNANRSKCHRRLETLLEPYLGRDVAWYCGSYGDVDQVAVEFLTERNEKVVVVGYDSFDISKPMLTLVEENKLPFVDAGSEQLPKGIRGPTDRDVLFLTKADAVVLLWNGHSQGTLELIDWYRTQHKDHVVGFVG